MLFCGSILILCFQCYYHILAQKFLGRNLDMTAAFYFFRFAQDDSGFGGEQGFGMKWRLFISFASLKMTVILEVNRGLG